MKKLTRVKLINWHLFANQTIEIRGNLLISGDNGSGKSTLVDAIHYVLSGGLAQRKFNMASRNGLSGSRRTVETYMRARIGAVGREYLRPEGDIITHLALEFLDGNSPVTLGCVLQITGGVLLPAKFYELRGEIKDSLFFETRDDGSKAVLSYEGLRKAATAEGLPFIPLEAQTLSSSYAQVRRSLDLPDEYETLLSSAIAFDPNADLLEFTNDFLLQKRNVSLDEVKEAAKAYQDIATLLKHEEEKAQALLPLLSLSEERNAALKEEEALELLDLQLSVEEAEKGRKKAEEDLSSLREKEKELESRRLEINENLASLRQERAALESRDERNEISRLRGDVSLIDSRLETIASDETRLGEVALELDEGAKAMGLSAKFHNLLEKRDPAALRKAIEGFEAALTQARNELRTEGAGIKENRENLLEELKILAPKIATLQNHERDFPAGVKELYRLLKERFQLEGDFALTPLCDCLEITDESWDETIECFLGGRRYDAFLPQRYYAEAARLIALHPELRGQDAPGIIDASSLGDIPFKVENSVADLLRSAVMGRDNDELPLVRGYIDYLLGDIKAVEAPEGTGEYKWLTKDGLYYDGTSVRYIVREKDFMPVIGAESISRQLQQLKDRYADLSKRIAELEGELTPIEEKYSLSLRLDPLALRGLASSWKEEDDLKAKKEDTLSRIKAYEDSMGQEDLTKFANAIATIEEKEKVLREEQEALFGKRDALFEERGRFNLALEQAMKAKEEAKKSYDYYVYEHADPLVKDLAEHKLKGYGKAAYSRMKEEHEANKRLLSESERKIVRLMSSYNDKFNSSDIEPVLENLPLYLERYQKITKDSLVSVRSKAEQASMVAVENFKSGFLVGLRSNIEQAELQIKKLNATLKRHPFGSARSIYRFVVKPTGDPELRKIYDIAVNTSEDYYQNGLLSSLLSGENRSTMDYLFSILSSDSPSESSAETIERFCDYRNYLSYDIVETTPDGQEKRYSDNVRARSGGETQTPFYVLIAASFDSAFELKKRSGSSPCEIVMLDEAFNNMDSDRIEDMMEFYRSLDIQLLVSVPTSRFSYLADHIDSTLVLVSRNERLTCYQGGKKEVAETPVEETQGE